MLNQNQDTYESNETLVIPRDELETVVIDLQSLSDLLSIIDESDHYNDMVCRALKNNIEHIVDKLLMTMDSACC